MAIVGYARVSSHGQSLDVQRERLKAAGVEKLFEEKRSGVDTKRPALQRCPEYVREGDTLFVTKVDRMARSAGDFHAILKNLAEKGVGFRALDDAERTRPVARASCYAGRTVRISSDESVSDDRIALVTPRGHVEFDQIFASILAKILGAAQIKDVRALSPMIESLLRCRSIADIRSFLTRQGISLPSAFQGDDDGSENDLFDADGRIESAIRDMMGGLDTRPDPNPPPPPMPPSPPPAPVSTTPQPMRPPSPLPPLDSVELTIMDGTRDAPWPRRPHRAAAVVAATAGHRPRPRTPRATAWSAIGAKNLSTILSFNACTLSATRSPRM